MFPTVIHLVTTDAVEPISKTMASRNVWKKIFESEETAMQEWQPIKLEFTGDLKLTTNQMTPQIRFYSKRWQGYQVWTELLWIPVFEYYRIYPHKSRPLKNCSKIRNFILICFLDVLRAYTPIL